MALSLNKAAQTCGRSKATILEAIRTGRLSAPKDERGRYLIDPAELHRVYPFRAPDRSADQFPEPRPTPSENHPTPSTDLRAAALEREVELLREMLAKAETNADHWRIMAERQHALLADERPKGFWARLLGR